MSLTLLLFSPFVHHAFLDVVLPCRCYTVLILYARHEYAYGEVQAASWVASLGSLRYSDVFASGASDGALRIWQWDTATRQIRALCTAPVVRPVV